MTIRSDPGSVTGEVPPPSSKGGVAQGRRTRARFAVHLCLLATFAASLATVTLITEGWPHLVVGLAFVALAGVHVAQRRHTVARLLGTWDEPARGSAVGGVWRGRTSSWPC